jgi:hypothetical protein
MKHFPKQVIIMKLNKLIFLLWFCQFIFITGFGQKSIETVKFSYDVNGNRIKRWIEVLKITSVDSADSLHKDSVVKSNITYPNNLDRMFPQPITK